MSKTLKVGLIGAGSIANCHAGTLSGMKDFRITAICDTDPVAMNKTADTYGIADRYSDYRKLIAKADIEAILVCLPNFLHAPVSIAGLAAGKHVFCEKPMTVNLAAGRKMVAAAAAAKRKKLAFQVGVVWRQSPQALTVKKLIDDGKLGEVYHIRSVLVRRRGIPGLGGWFTTLEQSGGGPVVDLGVHWLDLSMHLADLWKPTAVSAANYAKFGPAMKGYAFDGMWAGPPKYDGTFDVEDYTTGLIRFGKKATINFNIAWAANGPDYAFIELLGDTGGVVWSPGGDTVTLHTQSGRKMVDKPVKVAGTEDYFTREFRLFANACRGKGEVPATATEGLAVVKVLAAINASAKKGSEVKITG